MEGSSRVEGVEDEMLVGPRFSNDRTPWSLFPKVEGDSASRARGALGALGGGGLVRCVLGALGGALAPDRASASAGACSSSAGFGSSAISTSSQVGGVGLCPSRGLEAVNAGGRLGAEGVKEKPNAGTGGACVGGEDPRCLYRLAVVSARPSRYDGVSGTSRRA